MAVNSDFNTDISRQELIITRVFDAPRELAFKAWIEAERLAHWWGPKGMDIQISQLDFRPGGVFHYSMQTPDGHEMWGKFVYGEISAPERLEYVNSFSNQAGEVIRAPFSETWPLEIHNTLTFIEAEEGKTTLTLRGIPINATEEEHKTFESWFDSMQKGFAGTLDQLTAYLANA